MAKNLTKVVCANCGAEIVIPEHGYVTTGAVIGHDSGLGTIILKTEDNPDSKGAGCTVATTSKAEKMREALKNSGVNVDNIFSINDTLFRGEEGKLSAIQDNDPIFAKIKANGTIPNKNLFRRWIMSQVYHGLLYKDGFTGYMKGHGYEYTWAMLEKELATQVKIRKHHDAENFVERNRFFNKAVVVEMAEHYMEHLHKYVDGLKVRKCKGKPYKRVMDQNIFVKDLDKKLFKPLNEAIEKMKKAVIPMALANAVAEFNRKRKPMIFSTPQCKAWQNAYKGVGAYYTLKNMVLFHGNFVIDDEGNKLYEYDALEFVKTKAEEYKNEGWRLFGLFVKAMKDNNVDIKAKIASWRK